MDQAQTLAEIATSKWKSIWAGDWTYFDCSDWGEFYLTDLKIESRPFLDKVLFLFRKGKVSAWVDGPDLQSFSDHLKSVYADDVTKVEKLADDLREATTASLNFIQEHIDSEITEQVYREYLGSIRNYYYSHVSTKYFFESLDEIQIEKYLPILQPARIFAEPVFTRTVDFDRALAGQIFAKTGMKSELVLSMIRPELLEYFTNGNLPDTAVLEDRFNGGVIVFLNPTPQIYTGDAVEEIEHILVPQEISDTLKGSPAYPGVVQGRVRIVIDPQNEKDFQEGEILVTKMTRPEYLPFMQMCAAIVTDAGGVLSHAAISARELKKPAVIGTQKATQVLKTGDLVEVDADAGTIRIIN